ncbi:MAG: malonyl-CoA decarboxylase family protein, partial [Pseudomonadota bacterium]
EKDRKILQKKLHKATLPKRINILKQFSTLPQGLEFLVSMRAHCLKYVKTDNKIKELSEDLKQILIIFFDIGLLDLQQIQWNCPASLLEKLIAYEAVHQITSWNDLKNRLDSDRQCFAFFHYKMPNEPLIFVEVALTKVIMKNIHELLDEKAPEVDPNKATTAIFYSISNTHAGLGGINLGNFLIKRVVDKLTRDYPNLKDFVTLSPIPGFKKWLDKNLSTNYQLISENHKDNLIKNFNDKQISKNDHINDILINLLSDNSWVKDQQISQSLMPIMYNLCQKYLCTVKDNGKVIDPVANFHLSNGARIEYINWLANLSEKGMQESYGMMVNYRYILNKIDINHENYMQKEFIAKSKNIKYY